MSRRRPSSAASRSTRSRLRSAHRPDDEVITEAAHRPLLGVRPDPGPHRYSATDVFVQVRLGPAPVGLEEAVSAVPRDEHRLHAGSDRAGQLGQRRPADEEVSDLGQVVAGQPEPATPSGVTGVVREHHHAASHAPHLAQAGDRVRPVMNGGERHRGVEGLVLERKALRGGSHARRCACGTLRTHDRRRLHRGDVTVGGLVGAGAGPDVQHRPCIAERSPDLRGDPRLGAPRHGVGGSDGVVQLRAGLGHVHTMGPTAMTRSASRRRAPHRSRGARTPTPTPRKPTRYRRPPGPGDRRAVLFAVRRARSAASRP